MTKSVKILTDDDFSPLVLPAASAMRREPPRPKSERQPGFEDEFDFLSIFYDAFLWKDGAEVRLIGPKMLNLTPFVEAAHISVSGDESRTPLPFRYHEKRKVAYVDVVLPEGERASRGLRIDLGELGAFELKVQPSGLPVFKDKRVAFTLFKYEPDHWLRDWAYFNAVYHGAEAFLVYHNDCPNRTSAQIAHALEGLPGVELVVVANWPYPYGPSDGGTGKWDSNFCQVGMLEQMRWRFLQDARSVLHSDIDELIVTNNGSSVFEMAEQAVEQYVQFPGQWVSGDGPIAGIGERRHKDFCHLVDDPDGKAVEYKWAAVPKAFGEDKRWIVHELSHSTSSCPPFEVAGLRHFRPINTGWKLDRIPTGSVVKPDDMLREAYRKVGWLP